MRTLIIYYLGEQMRNQGRSVEYEINWRVISPDRQKISPSDVLFSNSDISITNGGTKKVLIFSENLGSYASYGFGFMPLSQFVYNQHSFEKKFPKLRDFATCRNYPFSAFCVILKKCLTLRGCNSQTI